MIVVLPKGRHKRAIVPERPVLPAAKTFEHFGPMSSQIGQDRARVVKFIRRRDQSRRGIGVFQVDKISFLAFAPGWLRRLIGIGATIHDFGDVIAELFSDID